MAENGKALTKRQKRAIESRNRIYSAAIQLMDHKGFENLTIAEISRHAGVSVGAFYHYFDSKHDILEEIFRKADQYFESEVAPTLSDDDVPSEIIDYFCHYARFNERSGVDMVRQLFNTKIRIFVRETRPLLSLLRELIRAGQENGQISASRTPEELTRSLFYMARGIVFDWSLHDGGYDLETTMRREISMLVSTFRM